MFGKPDYSSFNPKKSYAVYPKSEGERIPPKGYGSAVPDPNGPLVKPASDAFPLQYPGFKAQAGDKEPFVLNESELHVLYDMLHERLKHAEKELPSGHESLRFDEGLLYKLIDAMTWARSGDTVKVSREAKEQEG